LEDVVGAFLEEGRHCCRGFLWYAFAKCEEEVGGVYSYSLELFFEEPRIDSRRWLGLGLSA
jgi:hypothetical protein